MGKSSHINVNNIPLMYKPLYFLYGYGFGLIIYLISSYSYYKFKLFQRIEYTGKENLPDSNYIYCFWHCNILMYFSIFRSNNSFMWMQHPGWYVKPSHVMLRLFGAKYILGSTGHSGQEAAKKLVESLKQGYSTVMLPDGPNGPRFIFHKGILHIAMESQVPIVPMRFILSKNFELNTWDKKRLPAFFSKIRVHFGTPITVTKEKFDTSMEEIIKALGT